MLVAAALEPVFAQAAAPGPEPLRIALVIPVFNGGFAFERCLAAVRALSPQPDELIVIDDGSTDRSAQLAREAGARVQSLAVCGGPAAARNLGAQLAESPLILFLDADVVAKPDLISAMRAVFAETPGLTAAFGSYDDTPDVPTFISQYKNLFHHFIHQGSASEASTFWSGCGAVRRAPFLLLGGFDARYKQPCIEDIELGYRLRAAGHRIGLRRQVQVKHLKRWTMWNQLHTDFFHRALPWSQLLLQRESIEPDLNLTWSSRISVALAAAMTVLLALMPWSPAARWCGAALLALQLTIDLPLWSFFRARRGSWFALRALLWHRHYPWICGFGFACGLARHLFVAAPARQSSAETAGPR